MTEAGVLALARGLEFAQERRRERLAQIRRMERAANVAMLFAVLAPIVASFVLSACSKHNPVAPQLAQDYDCAPCAPGAICPAACLEAGQ